MKAIYSLILFLLSIVKMPGQNATDKYAKAQKLFLNNRYAEAVQYYTDLLKTDSSNANLNFKVGVCYLHSRSQKAKAAFHFESASKSISNNYSDNMNEREAPVLVYKLLGDVYHQLYDFDKAMIDYEKYKAAYKDIDKSLAEEINWKIEMCKIGKQLNGLSAPVELKKENEIKNPVYGSYSSTISPDQNKMIFTFQRSMTKNNPSGSSDIFYDDNLLPGNLMPLTASEKKINMNEATIGSSVDGQILLNYRDENGIANLYATYLKGNTWTVPEKLDRAINSTGWEEGEYVSADGTILYFTSERKEGYGGKDIYRCKKLADGSWGKAVNLGPEINTPFDEEAPFILPDGITLYFSSNGHKKTEQVDILSSKLVDGDAWSSPMIVGFPIDTTHDQAGAATVVTVAPENKNKKHSKDSKIEDTEIAKNNYMATFIRPNSSSFTILKGEIKDENNNAADEVKITLTDIESNEVSAVYLSETPGKFSFIMPSRKNTNVTFEKEGYLFTSQNKNIFHDTTYFEIGKPIQISRLAVDAKTNLNNVFFGPDNGTLRSLSNYELDHLSKFLNANQSLVVEISANSNADGSYKTNFKLSQQRANEITNYLNHNGISKERVIAAGLTKARLKEIREQKDPSSSNQGIEMKILEIRSEKANSLTTQ